MKIKVLWIDDQPNKAFVDNAFDDGIDITVCENVDDGINELLNSRNSYDAIILDANCLYHNDGTKEPDVSALNYALKEITRNGIKLPWFVYSGGGFSGEESISIIVKAYEREYDSNEWYKKPGERKSLFGKIKEVVPNSQDYSLKSKYADIFSWYPNAKELLNIIKFVEIPRKNDPGVFNMIRKELDWVMEHLYECGLLQEPYKGSNLAECSAFLGNKSLLSIVPLYIQRSFHSATTICNEGSHRLLIDDHVTKGEAPYLIQSTVFEFLNILRWMNKYYPKNPQEREKLKANVIDLLKETTIKENPAKVDDYEGKDFIVEKDENNNYHCGSCRLSYSAASRYLGKKVTLYDVKENDGSSKDNYPYFAKFRSKE